MSQWLPVACMMGFGLVVSRVMWRRVKISHTPPTPTQNEYKTTKRDLRPRYRAIANTYTPEGYTIEYCEPGTGMIRYREMLMRAPKPTNRKNLYVYLHECGHFQLGHSWRDIPLHKAEMEAETFVQEKFDEYGLVVPSEMLEVSRDLIAYYVLKDQAEGIKVKRKIRSYIQGYNEELVHHWLAEQEEAPDAPWESDHESEED